MKCPWCNHARHVVPCGNRNFYCGCCKREFDDDPDEGGTAYTDPTKRIEKAEERQGRRFVRRARS